MKDRILSCTVDEYIEKARIFHGYAAPGVIIGGFMVDLAYRHLPDGGFFDALCETDKCLPDAIQLLTPCTVGNGWLTIVNIGRYAFALYDKSTGQGVRIYIDTGKVNEWPEIRGWFFKQKPKKEQDMERLLEEIREAGADICSFEAVKIPASFLAKRQRGALGVCPECREGYPVSDGGICLGCQGKIAYMRDEKQ